MNKNEKIKWLLRECQVYKDRYANQVDYVQHLETMIFKMREELARLRRWHDTITKLKNPDVVNAISEDIIHEFEEGDSFMGYNPMNEINRILREEDGDVAN